MTIISLVKKGIFKHIKKQREFILCGNCKHLKYHKKDIYNGSYSFIETMNSSLRSRLFNIYPGRYPYSPKRNLLEATTLRITPC